MSKKKGLNIEEKKSKMMEIFFERKDFFQLKELEKIGPKEKGIVSQSVKDVVQSLVDDGFVDSEKIGTSVYFWAFPSKAANNRKRKFEELMTDVDKAEKKRKLTVDQLSKMKQGREDSDERAGLLSQLEALKQEKTKLVESLQAYKDCDPEVLEQVRKETKTAKEAVNRWTDNIFSLKSWCKNKFNMEENTLNKQFGIPEDLDYIS